MQSPARNKRTDESGGSPRKRMRFALEITAVLSLASNHTGDWGPEAVSDTLDTFNALGIPTVGAGRNIAEARRPVIIDTGAFILMIHPSVPARNVKELVAIARNRPGHLNYATSGSGSSAHLAAELMNSLAKVKTIHVPYKGVSQGVVGVASGEAWKLRPARRNSSRR
ncbi:MAG: hypothetical protein A3G24_05205 [Betaproteobacteria bacterium RIFCSPLOWO2_12_FULL_62_13]|nr:MAG: hypothetical protein A3G24_05205 [Betaproteobacteria bacterium RIFCSPLOWO2_12_FULL_62_13]